MTAFTMITNNTVGARNPRCGQTFNERMGTVTAFSLDSAPVMRL